MDSSGSSPSYMAMIDELIRDLDLPGNETNHDPGDLMDKDEYLNFVTKEIVSGRAPLDANESSLPVKNDGQLGEADNPVVNDVRSRNVDDSLNNNNDLMMVSAPTNTLDPNNTIKISCNQLPSGYQIIVPANSAHTKTSEIVPVSAFVEQAFQDKLRQGVRCVSNQAAPTTMFKTAPLMRQAVQTMATRQITTFPVVVIPQTSSMTMHQEATAMIPTVESPSTFPVVVTPQTSSMMMHQEATAMIPTVESPSTFPVVVTPQTSSMMMHQEATAMIPTVESPSTSSQSLSESSGNKKRKLYEEDKFDNPKDEKRRKNAVNAREHRLKNKLVKEALKIENAKLKDDKNQQEAFYQEEIKALKIALTQQQLKYQNLEREHQVLKEENEGHRLKDTTNTHELQQEKIGSDPFFLPDTFYTNF